VLLFGCSFEVLLWDTIYKESYTRTSLWQTYQRLTQFMRFFVNRAPGYDLLRRGSSTGVSSLSTWPLMRSWDHRVSPSRHESIEIYSRKISTHWLISNLLSELRGMQLRIMAFSVKRYRYFQPTMLVPVRSLAMEFGRVSWITSKHLDDSAVLCSSAKKILATQTSL